MNPQCRVPECTKPVRSSGAELCGMHYHRLYRHGSVEKVARGPEHTVVRGRYKKAHAPGHPLACITGMVYVHRRILYDLIGPGSHACHWCAKSIVWEVPEGDPSRLHVDHLNGVRDDNRSENLVPACKACNTTRGCQARHRALVEAGYWSGNDTIERLSRGGRRPPLVAV